MKVTIFEGPDGAGKTTMAHLAFPDAHHVHLGVPKYNALAELVSHVDASIKEAIAQGKDHVVFDRLHLSEAVYGPLFRGGSGIDPVHMRLLERWLMGRQAVVVLAMPDREVAEANWAERAAIGGEAFADRWRDVYEGYKRVETSLPTVRVDYVHHHPTAVASAVEFIRPPAHLVAENDSTAMVGHADARTLIVGPGLGGCGLPLLSQYLSLTGARARDLAKLLDEAGVSESELCWSVVAPPPDVCLRFPRIAVTSDLFRAYLKEFNVPHEEFTQPSTGGADLPRLMEYLKR